MEEKRLLWITKIIIVLSAFYFVASVLLLALGVFQLFMAWNLFLAILPLYFARNFQSHVQGREKKKGKRVLWAALWFFFFPNAPYMITDFIHISNHEFLIRENPYAPLVYSTDIILWIRLVHIGTGVFLGTAAGMLSLYLIHQIVLNGRGQRIAACLIGAVCFLSGYAIYIGRFLRLNSWDILRPIYLISTVWQNLNLFSLEFSLLIAGYVLVTYWLFYVFLRWK